MTRKIANIVDWGMWGLIIGAGTVVIGWLWVALIAGVSSMQQVEANTSRIRDHEQRIRLVEQDLNEVRNDVAWIRHHLENGAR